MRGIAQLFSSRIVPAMLLSLASQARGQELVPTPIESDASAISFYEEEVRPILVRRCYECHSGSIDELQGELALDRRRGWEKGGGRGPAIIAGNPEKSLLIEAIGYLDADLQMPPDSKLPQAEIATLEKWIAHGAPAPQDNEESPASAAVAFDLESRRAAHWAWQPVQKHSPPEVNRTEWPRNAIDRFVLQRLEREKLVPAAEADRNTWLRRVTFDLTGLPPTPRELADFLADNSIAAYEKVVDRLLESDAFGECWGQHWLDLVRFAETKGHEQDFEIEEAWRYRDYVIEAFNVNVPFDVFVREHLAGDLIKSPRLNLKTQTNQSIQGTAFWHLGEATHSPVDIRGDEADRIDNQIDVLGKAILGLTIACARCHDHKFDAISTADYYALCGFIESSSYQKANVANPIECEKVSRDLNNLHKSYSKQLFALFSNHVVEMGTEYSAAFEEALQETPREEPSDSLRAEIARAREEPDHPLHVVAKLARELQKNPGYDTRAFIEEWRTAASVSQEASVKSIVDFTRDNSDWITSGYTFGFGPVAVGEILLRPNPRQPIAAIATEPAAHGRRLSPQLTGFYRTPTFQVASRKLWYRFRGKAAVFAVVDSHRTVAGPLHGVVNQQLDSPDRKVWFAHDLSDYVGHRAHVEFTPQGDFELFEVQFAEEQPESPPPANELLLELLHDHEPRDLSSLAKATSEVLVRAVEISGAGDGDRGAAELTSWLLANEHLLPQTSSSAREEFDALAAVFVRRHKQLEARIPEPIWAIALLDGNGVDEYVHLRGSHKRLAPEPTPRRFLAALDGHIDHTIRGSGRMQLAEKLVAPDNPLTSRVFVNRVWHHLFGKGIVATVDNFGVLGEPPTHPELLDYLAAEFVADGWNTKNLIRRIALSSTYRMSSSSHSDSDSQDPANRLLHAARVRRLPAEAIRDSLLAVAGNLNRNVGGSSVPAHITDFMRNFRSPPESGPFDGDRRRSIYLQVRRNSMSHFLTAFDKPTPASTVGARHVSNSPAQPLILLNDPFVISQAEIWATALVDSSESNHDRIENAFLCAYSRKPDAHEVKALDSFLDSNTISTPSREDQIELWKQICLTLINVKEFTYLR